jgi:hypothetical protein
MNFPIIRFSYYVAKRMIAAATFQIRYFFTMMNITCLLFFSIILGNPLIPTNNVWLFVL